MRINQDVVLPSNLYYDLKYERRKYCKPVDRIHVTAGRSLVRKDYTADIPLIGPHRFW